MFSFFTALSLQNEWGTKFMLKQELDFPFKAIDKEKNWNEFANWKNREI